MASWDWASSSAALLTAAGTVSAWAGATATSSLALLDAAYVGADPLVSGTALALLASWICWYLSVVTGNYSWTDRFWSITPAIYSVHFGFHASIVAVVQHRQTVLETVGALLTRTLGGVPDAAVVLPSARLTILAVLPVLWGARLTFNFARKGGYRPEFEDYRWAIVRTWFHPAVYQIFNVVFIALYQNILIFLIVLPAYVALRADAAAPALTPLDLLATAAFLGLLAMETVADQQQWDFQTEKYRLLATVDRPSEMPAVYARGFVTSGLFTYSRHPVHGRVAGRLGSKGSKGSENMDRVWARRLLPFSSPDRSASGPLLHAGGSENMDPGGSENMDAGVTVHAGLCSGPLPHSPIQAPPLPYPCPCPCPALALPLPLLCAPLPCLCRRFIFASQNFFAEMSQWWVYYLFGVAASGVWLNWTIVGTVLLTLLFQGSTLMTEILTARKYPEYREYQRTTSTLIPWPPGTPIWSVHPVRSASAASPAASPAPSPVLAAAPSKLSAPPKSPKARTTVASPRQKKSQ